MRFIYEYIEKKAAFILIAEDKCGHAFRRRNVIAVLPNHAAAPRMSGATTLSNSMCNWTNSYSYMLIVKT